MARFINHEKDIIDRNIDNNSLTTSIEYSKYFEGTPTFVTYYSKNITESTQDHGLEDVKQIVGSEAPIKYDKVEEFPLYGIDNISPRQEINEFGYSLDVESEAVILPDTLRPLPNDLFTIDYNREKLIFEITAVEIDKLNGKKYYRVMYQLSTYNKDILDEQIEDEYISHYENIGTQNKTVIPKKDSILIQNITEVKDRLSDFYIRQFTDTDSDFLVYKHGEKYLYNEYLIRFLLNTKILTNRSNRFLKNFYIQDIMPDETSLYYIYEETIYNAIEKENKDLFKLENFRSIEIIKDPTMPFYFNPKKYYRCQYKIDHNLHKPHKDEFIARVLKDNEYEDKDNFYLENIIIKFLNKRLEIDNILLFDLKDKYFYSNMRTFLLLPILVYILDKKKQNLENKILRGEHILC